MMAGTRIEVGWDVESSSSLCSGIKLEAETPDMGSRVT